MADTVEKSEIKQFLETIGKIKGMNYMGARDKDGKKLDRGLVSDQEVIPRTEFGAPMMDGFNFDMAGDVLNIKYQGISSIKTFNKSDDYEKEIIDIMEANVKWIKKTFKEECGKTLNLKKIEKSEPIVRFEPRNSHQSMAYGAMKYEILNLPGKKVATQDESFDFEESLKKFRGL